MPPRVIVFDQRLGTTYSNRQAENFLKRFSIPDAIETISKRIFDARGSARLKEHFPGDIHISKKLDASPSTWTFKVQPHEGSIPFVRSSLWNSQYPLISI